jgi:hypothetical protein
MALSLRQKNSTSASHFEQLKATPFCCADEGRGVRISATGATPPGAGLAVLLSTSPNRCSRAHVGKNRSESSHFDSCLR